MVRVRRRLLLLLLVLLCGGATPLAADEGAGVKQGVDDIQEDINQAIDRGVMWLLKEQIVDGSWGHEAGRYPGGMTGLALYTLLKSGVPATHPCVELGLENILSLEPQETYNVACHLMALGATGDPAHHPRMAVLAERLLSWESRGSWSYPLAHEGSGWADRGGIPDLSNAQFAVLGLYAAQQAGIKIPKKVVQDVIRQLRFHQHIPREVVGTDGEVRDAAGFAYRPPDQHGIGVATGSMTCAGITVMDVCRRLLGKKLTGKPARVVETAIEFAIAWLDANWSVEENPGREQAHKLYYLYGLERVGSLLGRERIGGHAWYSEGARELLKLQKKGGEWGNQSDTCFGLLFLLRATKGQVTGEDRARAALPSYATPEDAPLRIRAEGHSPMSVWVTSMDPKIRGKVLWVEYLVNDKVELTVAQGPWPHRADATHRVALHFPHAGTWKVRARATVDGPAGVVIAESTPLEVEVKLLVQPWALYEASWVSRNLLDRDKISASASTAHAAFQGPDNAVDGRTAGYWVCQSKPPDPRPTIHVKLGKPARANALVLFPVPRRDGDRRRFDRPAHFEVTLGGKGDPVVVPPAADELRPTVLRLPQITRLKSFEVAISARKPGATWPGECGFREVALEIEPVLPPTFAQDAGGTVTLASADPDAEIRYTLDGTIPTRDAPRYAGPFAWPHATRLHAIVRLPTGEESRLLIARTEAP